MFEVYDTHDFKTLTPAVAIEENGSDVSKSS